MPATYEPIQTTTLGSNQATVTLSSIPSTYTDIILVFNGSNSAGNDSYLVYMNGDTSALYSATYLEGDGSTAYSSRWSNRSDIPVARGASSTAGADMVIVQFQNYANTSVHKSVLSRYSLGNTIGARTSATVGLYRSTSAISSISIKGGSGNIVTGSTFTLYGIKAA